ncbi:MAG TPA: zf-HC2 domain-containing protein [Phycisphaerae bacterium]|nr:zf-HC2 domain-containing protein [Phycisphaerae bacterium]
MTTMDCDEIRTMLAGYADAELAALEREAVEAHLAHCGRCRALVADQKRVQRVLESYAPPSVPAERWSAMSRRLADELAGREHADLVTQHRLDSLDDLEDESPAEPRETREPAARPRPLRLAASRGPVLKVLGPRAKARRPRFAWVAHAVGAIAAAVLIAVGIATVLRTTDFGLAPDALATQADITIYEIQMLDPGYNLILFAGGPKDIAAVWVEPIETEG